MRILMAAAVPKRREGGIAIIMNQLARRFDAGGNFVECIFSDDLGPYDGVPARFRDLSFALRLARHIRRNREKYSVANVHAPMGSAYAIKRWLHRTQGLPPYVMTLQGAEERYVQSMRKEAALGRARQFRWKNRVWHRFYHQSLYRAAIRGADYAIVANREAWAHLQLQHGLDAEKVWFVPNGVDESFFVPRSEETDGMRLLFVGTWLERKGIHYLRDAFVDLAGRFENLRLTVAGCIVDAANVSSWFPSMLHRRVSVMPIVSPEEMPRVYAEHDVFVFPSLMEGMPLSLLEAMASGMAVVTTDTCGMADVVEAGYNGLLVKPASTSELVKAVERVLCSAPMRMRLGKAAQESMERYTWDLVAERYLSVLRRAAAGPRIGQQALVGRPL